MGKSETFNDENYNVNFGVLKVTFPDQPYAKKITGDWFGKYIEKTPDGKYIKKLGSKHINFKAEPITNKRSKYLKDVLQLFTGGYPTSIKYRIQKPGATHREVNNQNNFIINQIVHQNDKADGWQIYSARNTMTDEEFEKIDWSKGSKLGLIDSSDYKYHLNNDFNETLIGLIDGNRYRQATKQAQKLKSPIQLNEKIQFTTHGMSLI